MQVLPSQSSLGGKQGLTLPEEEGVGGGWWECMQFASAEEVALHACELFRHNVVSVSDAPDT